MRRNVRRGRVAVEHGHLELAGRQHPCGLRRAAAVDRSRGEQLDREPQRLLERQALATSAP